MSSFLQTTNQSHTQSHIPVEAVAAALEVLLAVLAEDHREVPAVHQVAPLEDLQEVAVSPLHHQSLLQALAVQLVELALLLVLPLLPEPPLQRPTDASALLKPMITH